MGITPNLTGQRVQVLWPNNKWYKGTVVRESNSSAGTHEILYSDEEAKGETEPIIENIGGWAEAKPVKWEIMSEESFHQAPNSWQANVRSDTESTESTLTSETGSEDSGLGNEDESDVNFDPGDVNGVSLAIHTLHE